MTLQKTVVDCLKRETLGYKDLVDWAAIVVQKIGALNFLENKDLSSISETSGLLTIWASRKAKSKNSASILRCKRPIQYSLEGSLKKGISVEPKEPNSKKEILTSFNIRRFEAFEVSTPKSTINPLLAPKNSEITSYWKAKERKDLDRNKNKTSWSWKKVARS